MVFDPNGYTNGYTDCRLTGLPFLAAFVAFAPACRKASLTHDRLARKHAPRANDRQTPSVDQSTPPIRRMAGARAATVSRRLISPWRFVQVGSKFRSQSRERPNTVLALKRADVLR